MAGNTVTLTFAGDASKLNKAMKGVGDGARKMGADVERASDQMAKGSQASASKFQAGLGKLKAAAAVGGGLAGAGLTAAFVKSLEFGSAQAKLTAQLGAGTQISQDAGQAAGHLYAQAYGSSLEEVGDAVRTVMQAGLFADDASSAQIEALTGKVMSLSQAFGQDLNGTVNAVGQMLRTGLAQNGDEALDILTVGFQRGNDKAGDLLDTVNEYGTQFRKVGLDGRDMMGLISQGLKAGARDADIVADAIKEFSIRAVDGSKTTVDGFKSIGLNADIMREKIAKGGPAAKEGLGQVLDGLRAIKDPAERSRIAVELFGTQAEDLGDALYALDLDTTSQGLGNVDGAAQQLNDTLNDTAANKIESVKRGFEQWGASLVEVKGPVGDIGAAVAAFGPQAISTLSPLASMLAALKMNGAVSALSTVGAGVDAVGTKADTAAVKSGKLKTALKGIGVGLALGAIAVGMDQINAASEQGNLSGWNGELHDIARILSGDWGNPIADINAELDQVNQKWSDGQAPVQQWALTVGRAATDAGTSVQNFFRGLVGLPPLPPVKLDVDPATGQAKVNEFVGGVSRTRGTAHLDAEPSGAVATLAGWKGSAGATTGMAKLNADPGLATGKVVEWKSTADRATGQAHLAAETSSATATIRNWVSTWNGYTIRVGVGAVVSSRIGGLATGGPVEGPGTGTSDTAGLFALSDGEYVATARQVAAAGGPTAFGRLMDALEHGPVRGFADGGEVMRASARAAMRPAAAPSSARAGAGATVTFAGNTSDALATVIMRMIRENKIQIKAA